jgi:hypothetical protein
VSKSSDQSLSVTRVHDLFTRSGASTTPKLVYLTFLESPSGIYQGQVIDVCRFFKSTFGIEVDLVAMVSPRTFGADLRKIKSIYPTAVVIPAPLGWRAWTISKWLHSRILERFLRRGASSILCRGPVATVHALGLRDRGIVQKVGYDGRGAVAAEWEEYAVAPGGRWVNLVPAIEAMAVRQSDFRLAVSEKLVRYWRERYNYNGNAHVIVPCTLSNHHSMRTVDENEIRALREKLGFKIDDIIICYSGSGAEWHSLDLLDTWLYPIFRRDPRVSLLVLSDATLDRLRIRREFGDRMRQLWVPPDQVPKYLSLADYGFLVRRDAITNRVAAPTKFAEYLAAGLKILISPCLGDYSDLVEREKLGCVVRNADGLISLELTGGKDRRKMIEFAHTHFEKSQFRKEYESVITNLIGVIPDEPGRN